MKCNHWGEKASLVLILAAPHHDESPFQRVVITTNHHFDDLTSRRITISTSYHHNESPCRRLTITTNHHFDDSQCRRLTITMTCPFNDASLFRQMIICLRSRLLMTTHHCNGQTYDDELCSDGETFLTLLPLHKHFQPCIHDKFGPSLQIPFLFQGSPYNA